MQIVDLSYLGNIPETDLILGSVRATVAANASATGSSPKTYASTNTFAKPLRNGGAIAIGTGLGIANGNNPTANVAVAGEGDFVIDIDGSGYLVSKNTAIALGIVIAIDLPRKKG
ncbi:hypothetical protein DSM106972_005080 [Dulcicalothrix desertica PCC 7102]|uniref:Uncharacterized protein n=1 Tax=Dulcicalothrix desertica PCC 7102 TaxID=232991 RepID=A0A3S1CWE7_9CYAN|nr:hypothetical protein [Dulcicalothrix desertica]RUT10013.1 hypothetical protein DSM106972_005080 [Dulcicalothrix desertica PCC 7102]TWH41008.1 hypothetical protein CAL7102_10373 [Dulcicalothrix desertica PCC 7102]